MDIKNIVAYREDFSNMTPPMDKIKFEKIKEKVESHGGLIIS